MKKNTATILIVIVIVASIAGFLWMRSREKATAASGSGNTDSGTTDIFKDPEDETGTSTVPDTDLFENPSSGNAGTEDDDDIVNRNKESR